MDDAIERSMTAKNPDDVARWAQARREYRNMIVLEKAATGAGENAAMGLISPAALRTAAASQSKRAYARGQGDFSELARAGVAVMSPLPQSGTAPRAAVRGMTNIPAAIGAVAGSPAGLPGAIAGAVAGNALPGAIGSAILSRPGRAYLGNQLMRSAPSPDPRGLGPLSSIAISQPNSLDQIERPANALARLR